MRSGPTTSTSTPRRATARWLKAPTTATSIRATRWARFPTCCAPRRPARPCSGTSTGGSTAAPTRRAAERELRPRAARAPHPGRPRRLHPARRHGGGALPHRLDGALGEVLRKGRVEFRPELTTTAPRSSSGTAFPPASGRGISTECSTSWRCIRRRPSFLATKLCRRFLADPPPRAPSTRCRRAFLASGGDVRRRCGRSSHTEAFRAVRAPSSSARSASSSRRCAPPPPAPRRRRSLDYLLSMGQAPFQYPTPDGYPEAETPWLGTLLWRWKLRRGLAADRIPGRRSPRRAAAGVRRARRRSPATSSAARPPSWSAPVRRPGAPHRRPSALLLSALPPRFRVQPRMETHEPARQTVPPTPRSTFAATATAACAGGRLPARRRRRPDLVPPVGDDGYHRARPLLGVGEDEGRRLDDLFALHPHLGALGRSSTTADWRWSTPPARTTDPLPLRSPGSDGARRPGVGGGWLGRYLRYGTDGEPRAARRPCRPSRSARRCPSRCAARRPRR